MEAIQIFEYEGKQIEFDLGKTNMMVNATEMAKVFDKRVDVFLKTEPTKEFINVLKFTPTGGNLNAKSDTEIMITKGRSGTWMCRILALKFAAWLDPKFEVWVFETIDKILFGDLREFVINKHNAEQKRDELHQKLLSENPDYVALMGLEETARAIAGRIKKQQRTQLNILFNNDN